MAFSKLEGRIAVPSGGWSMDVTEITGGIATVTVAGQGTYFLKDLIVQIGSALTANATLVGTYTLSLDDDSLTSTGRVTVTFSGVGGPGLVTLNFNQTALRDALGCTTGLAGTSPLTSPNASPFIWLPNCQRGPALAPDGTVGAPLTDASFTMAKHLVYSTRYADILRYQYILGQKAWTTSESVINESLQTWWLQVIGRGYPFRYHPDRSVDATYVEYRAVKVGEMGLSAVVPTWTSGSASLWSWETEVVKLV
jgi:hypothetical protein